MPDLVDHPRRVLVVVAHPDDIDFGMAGTMAVLTSGGSDVVYCLVTSGEAGGPDELSREALRDQREAEQRAAAAIVGVTDLRFLRYADGRVECTLGLRRDISRVIREVRPDLVMSLSSVRDWDRVYFSHPDHLAVAEATACAVYPDARNPHSHTELLAEGHQPHTVERMWVSGLEPNRFVDITDHFDRKLAALQAHVSQVSSRANLADMLRSWAAANAAQGGLEDGRLAEMYREIDTR